jgi:hypothetical protein
MRQMSDWDRSTEAFSFAGADFATGAARGKVRDGFATGAVCGALLSIRFLVPPFLPSSRDLPQEGAGMSDRLSATSVRFSAGRLARLM